MCHSGDQRSLTRALCPSTRRAHWLPASRTTISRPPPRRSDWSDAGECDVEFDRLISGRGSYKGGIGGVMLSADREGMLREAAAEPARTTEDVSVGWQEREREKKKSGREVVCIMVITRHTAAVYWRNVNYIHRNIQSPLTELQLTLRQGAERDLTQWVNVTLQGRVTDISYK